MQAIQKQMVEANKNERANALKKLKRLCNEVALLLGYLGIRKRAAEIRNESF